MKKPRGESAFDQFYSSLWAERWPSVKAHLQAEKPKVSLFSTLNGESGIRRLGSNDYLIDPASLLVAAQLTVVGTDSILDLCAAPGGKSLALIAFSEGSGRYLLNEYSENRRARLLRVLKEHLSDDVLARVEVKGWNGERFGLKFARQFNKVLVDVPCSGERYQLSHPEKLKEWSIKSSKSLAIRQHSLLCSGFECLKPGGRLVYATCSLSRLENEEVIRKFLKKRSKQGALLKPAASPRLAILPKLAPAEFGDYILPDENSSMGPLYFAVIERT